MRSDAKKSILTLCVLLTACSEPLPHVAHFECAQRAAQALDDGVSAPEAIAVRVSAACLVEKRKSVEVMLARLNVVAAGEPLQVGLRNLSVETDAVMFVRSVRAQEPPK